MFNKTFIFLVTTLIHLFSCHQIIHLDIVHETKNDFLDNIIILSEFDIEEMKKVITEEEIYHVKRLRTCIY